MKTIKCNDLGGACELEFRAETFEEVAKMSKQHGMEMFKENDEAHLSAMKAMQEMMQKPGVMERWFEEKRNQFNALSDDGRSQ